MKILFVNAMYRRGGAAIALLRLMEALNSGGIETKLLLMEHNSRDPRIVLNAQHYPLRYTIGKLMERIPLLMYSNRWKLLKNLNFSPAILRSDSHTSINEVDADIVHLHWVNHGHLSPEGISEISRPIVWTAHDMWAFSGGCHHSDDCERYRDTCGMCPVLGSTSPRDLSRTLWTRKHDAWECKPISLVCPSRWLAQRASSSSLFSGRAISIIPNPLDIEFFSPRNMYAARSRLGLPHDVPMLFYGANKALTNRSKGFYLLDRALSIIAKSGFKPHLVVAGATERERHLVNADVPIHLVGYLDADQIVDAYSAADVFVLPSLRETLPNMVAEALACGRSVVAFDVGGISEMVLPGDTGYLAKPFDISDLAHGIVTTFERSRASDAVRSQARSFAEATFAPKRIAELYMDVYRSAIHNALDNGTKKTAQMIPGSLGN